MKTEESTKNKGKSVQTVDRAIDLLEVLMSASQPMTLSDLSSQTHLHPSTTHRLLSTMSDRKFVYQDHESKKYTIGPKLSYPSKTQAVIVNLQNIVTPILQELSQNTGETASMAIRTGNQVMYIAQVSSNRLINMFVKVGALVPMHCTGVGKAIMAYLRPEEIASIVEDGGLPSVTAQTITDSSKLEKELCSIREKGYAIDNEEREIGIRCVATPIISRDEKLIGSISISGPAGRVSSDKDSMFADLIKSSALKVTQKLS